METNNRTQAALELARFKMKKQMAEGRKPLLDNEDLNEILLVAGVPLLTPNELDEPDIDVIDIRREEK